METVSFTRMADGTREDYELLARYEDEYSAKLPDRLLAALDALKQSLVGYQVTRYEHSLQSATRAHRDGKSEEYVVAALLHDIGDELAPHTHSEMVGAILRPYVSEEICWIVAHHGVFQIVLLRRALRRRPERARAVPRRARTSTHAPSSASATTRIASTRRTSRCPVEFFEPMVRRVFAEPRYLPE